MLDVPKILRDASPTFALIGKELGYLFATYDLRETLDGTKGAIKAEIESLNPDRFLNTASADLEKYFCDKYRVEVPRVATRDKWVQDEKEAQVDVVWHDYDRMILDKSRPALVPGQQIDIEIPFDGDAEVFFARASRFTSSPPRGEIEAKRWSLHTEWRTIDLSTWLHS